MSETASTAVKIVTSSWFMPSYIGLVIGIAIGAATCFIADWRMSRPHR